MSHPESEPGFLVKLDFHAEIVTVFNPIYLPVSEIVFTKKFIKIKR